MMHFTSASTNSNSDRRSQTAVVFDVCLAGFDVGVSGATYIVIQELHDEGGHASVDADEEVDAGEHHVGRAGHAEDEGGRVHQRSGGPAADDKKDEREGGKDRSSSSPNLRKLWEMAPRSRNFPLTRAAEKIFH